MFDWSEYERWMAQAKHTLQSMRADMEFGSYGWACFKAQQAAELALKAFLRGAGRPAFGRDLRELALAASEHCGPLGDLMEDVLLLAKFYIPPRYPGAFPGGAPYQFYTRGEAEKAFRSASRVLEWVERCAERLRETAEGESGGEGQSDRGGQEGG